MAHIEFLRLLQRDHQDTLVALTHLETSLTSKPVIQNFQQILEPLFMQLQQHYIAEEKGLFSVLSAYKTMILMEVEHDTLMGQQHRLWQLVCEASPHASVSAEIEHQFTLWANSLRCHITEEENGVFPMADARLEPQEKRWVQQAVEAYLQNTPSQRVAYIQRPTPQWQQCHLNLSADPPKPIAYHTVFEAGHSKIQHITLQPQQSLALHWGGERQFLQILAGQGQFVTQLNCVPYASYQCFTIEPRLYWALQAKTVTHALLTKVWQPPHFTKAAHTKASLV